MAQVTRYPSSFHPEAAFDEVSLTSLGPPAPTQKRSKPGLEDSRLFFPNKWSVLLGPRTSPPPGADWRCSPQRAEPTRPEVTFRRVRYGPALTVSPQSNLVPEKLL